MASPKLEPPPTQSEQKPGEEPGGYAELNKRLEVNQPVDIQSPQPPQPPGGGGGIDILIANSKFIWSYRSTKVPNK